MPGAPMRRVHASFRADCLAGTSKSTTSCARSSGIGQTSTCTASISPLLPAKPDSFARAFCRNRSASTLQRCPTLLSGRATVSGTAATVCPGRCSPPARKNSLFGTRVATALCSRVVHCCVFLSSVSALFEATRETSKVFLLPSLVFRCGVVRSMACTSTRSKRQPVLRPRGAAGHIDTLQRQVQPADGAAGVASDRPIGESQCPSLPTCRRSFAQVGSRHFRFDELALEPDTLAAPVVRSS